MHTTPYHIVLHLGVSVLSVFLKNKTVSQIATAVSKQAGSTSGQLSSAVSTPTSAAALLSAQNHSTVLGHSPAAPVAKTAPTVLPLVPTPG